MANPSLETVEPPFTSFRFEVALNLDEPVEGADSPLCAAAFAECDGLEMSFEPKTYQQGGDNSRQIHLVAPVKYSQLTLRRGMTGNLDLWAWFAATARPGHVATAQGQVTVSDAAGTPRIVFHLQDCLPVKLKGPQLNARDGLVAIEEMQLAYSSLEARPPGAAGSGLAASIGIAGGVSVSVSGGAGLSGGLSVSASASAEIGFG